MSVAEPELARLRGASAVTDRRYYLEVAAWATVAVTAWASSAHFELFEKLVAFSREHERWQVGEVFSLIIIASITSLAASLAQARYQARCRHRAEREAFLAARRDVLTDLPNRRMFAELAGKALGAAWRKGCDCAVLFIDLDGFKPINDTHGHAAGDELLIAVADLLREQAPQPALPARLGGDEFAILLPNIASADVAVTLAEQLLGKLRQPLQIAGCEVRVGATVGIAIGPESGRRAEDLIHAADLAMYQAKRDCKGTVRVHGQQCEPQRPANTLEDAGSALAPLKGCVNG